MGIFSGLFRSRDKPKDSYDSPSYSYFFGRTHAGERTMTAIHNFQQANRLRIGYLGGSDWDVLI